MAYYNNFYPQYPYYPQNQSYANNNIKSMEWVDGEIGAKAFQMPSWLPPNTPIALWDNSEKKIWLKSWNPMGMANPMQEICYEIKERTNPAILPDGISGDVEHQYATKQDLESLREEIKNLSHSMQNNSANNNGGNRSGNR